MKKIFLLKNILFTLGILLILISCEKKDNSKAISSDTISVIPQPQLIEASEGIYTINQNTIIQYQGDLKHVAQYLSDGLRHKNTIQELKNTIKSQVLLSIVQNEALGKEGYELTVNAEGVKIKGTAAGAFYGVQTLIQLLIETDSNTIVPFVHIVDQPRFAWRGMHLDVSRHFFDIEFIKTYIDILAKHKLNVFHWHLTDDQGWRIEIDGYPKLAEIAAWRAGEADDEWNYDIHAPEEGKPIYGGVYTKDDIREVLAYAEEHFVTVIPEIELPAHSWGALLAYPNLSCTGEIWHMGEIWSFTDPFCAGNEETFTFFETVLTEVIDLFPSTYIHIGGDEAQKTKWEECSKCQNRIKTEGLKDEEELQSYFIKRIAKFVESKGRKVIGWDEILEGGLASGAAVMSWRGEEGGIKAVKQHHKVIMTPQEFLYFNKSQYDPVVEDIPYADVLTIETVYNYNPVPDDLSKEEQKNIIGTEACLWTEFIYSDSLAIQRLLPRISALSEIAWTAYEDKDWNRFQGKLMHYFAFLDRLGLDYFVNPPNTKEGATFVEESTDITLSLPFTGAQIYYTVDGSEPTRESSLYELPIAITSNTTIKAKTILPSGKESVVFEKTIRKISYHEATDLANVEEGILLNYYKGSISQLSEFGELKVLKEAEKVTTIDMPEGMPDDNFGLQYSGYVKIPKDGIYTFYTSSDDGSGLYVNGIMVVNNDGFHGMQEKNGEIALKTGYHKLSVNFFEGGGGEGLSVEMQGPDMEKATVHSSLLFVNNSP